MNVCKLLIVCLLASLCIQAAFGQANPSQSNAADGRTQDKEAIGAASKQLAKAFAAGDANAIAELFTEDAEYQDDTGLAVQGRKALADAYAKLFAESKGLSAKAQPESLRFLGKDTAIEEGVFTVTSESAPPNASRYSALYVRQDGKWLIALLKEWATAPAGEPNLDKLAWLIGAWETKSDASAAKTQYAWAADKKFIRMDFSITPHSDNEKPGSGIQIIGLDPATGHIRGWLFTSDGGIGESHWHWDGEQWLIESIATLADGTPTTAVNLLKQRGNDEFTWRSVGRTTGGEPEPDIPAVVVKRAKASGEQTGKP